MSAPPDRARTFARGTVSRDAAWSLAYTAVVRIATVGLLIAVARLVGSAGAGALGIALQVTALGSMLAAFNLPQSLTKQLAESEEPLRRRALLRTSGSLILGFGLVVGVLLMAFSRWIGERVYGDSVLAPVVFWSGPLVLATAITMWIEGVLQGFRRFERLARWGGAVAFLDLGLGVVAAFFGVVAVILTRAVVRAGAVLFALARWLHDGSSMTTRAAQGATAGVGPAEFDPDTGAQPFPFVGPLLGYAGPALLAASIALVGQTVLRVLLVRRAGLAAAGHYQAADSLAQGLLLIPSAAAVAFMPAVSRDRETGYVGLSRSLKRALEQITGYNLALCLTLIGLAPWAVTLLFGRAFGPAGSVLVLLAAAYGLLGPTAIFGAVLLGRGEVWIGFAVNLMWAAITLGSFWYLTGSLGAPGAALAIAAAYFSLLLVCLFVLAPMWTVPVRSLLPAVGVSVASLAIGSALALSARVPAPITAMVCVAFALVVFARWGLPSLRESRLGRMWS